MADNDRSNRKRDRRRYISSDAAETPLELGEKAFLAPDFTQALAFFKDAVKKGYLKAYYFLGLMYNEGLGVLENHQTAIKYWEEGKTQGDELCTLSLMEESEFQNTYNMVDSEEAIKAIERMENDSFYGFQLTRMCNDYGSFLLNGDQKWKCLKRCADEGNILAYFELYNFYQLDGKVDDARRALREAAKLHYPKALIKMGDCYVEENDLDNAILQYREARNHGIRKSNLPLGRIYFNRKEYMNAYPYIGQAAMSGEAEAMFIFGLMYKNGWGIKPNDDEADKWIQKAAENGFAEAREYLEKKQSDILNASDAVIANISKQDESSPIVAPVSTFESGWNDFLSAEDNVVYEEVASRIQENNTNSQEDTIRLQYIEFIDKMHADGLRLRDAAKKVVEKIIGGKKIEGWQFSPKIESTIIAKANKNYAGQNLPFDVMAVLDDSIIPPFKGRTGIMITSSKWIASPDKSVLLENISKVAVGGKIMDIACVDGTSFQYESKKKMIEGQIIERLVYALIYNAKKYKK